MADRLSAAPRSAGIAPLLPARSAGVMVSVVEPLRVVALRYLPEGAATVERVAEALALARLPDAGRYEGRDPYVVWRCPGEFLLITTIDDAAEGALRSLPAGGDPFAYAVDQSDGTIAFELTGGGISAVLPRLLDASAIPHQPGQGTRARLGDIAVIALRLEPERVWLLAERGIDRYLAQWIAYASEAGV